VLTVAGESLGVESPRRVPAPCPTVNWYPDHPMLDQVLDLAQAYALFCLREDWTASRLRAMDLSSTLTLAHASDPRVVDGSEVVNKWTDVSVLGSVYPCRSHWIFRLAAQGCSVHVWGGPGGRTSGISYGGRKATGRLQGIVGDYLGAEALAAVVGYWALSRQGTTGS
jgi:hypothetical protein